MTRKADAVHPVSEVGFTAFLQEETTSDLEVSTVGSDWSGLQASVWEQGDDAFTSPPLETHFVSLCLSGYAVADITMGSLSGSRFSLVSPDALCFMPAGDTADFCAAGRFDVAHILLATNAVDAVLAEHDDRDPASAAWQGFHGRKHPGIARTIQTILTEMRGANPCAPLTADRLAIELAQHLVGYACDAAPNSKGRSRARPDLTPLQFVTAVDYIEARLDQNFGLDEIAAYVGVDPLRLATAFETEAGVSIDHFHTERRLDTVRAWVAGSAADAPDGAIAKRIGFADADALDAAFRAHLGVSFDNFRAGKLI